MASSRSSPGAASDGICCSSFDTVGKLSTELARLLTYSSMYSFSLRTLSLSIGTAPETVASENVMSPVETKMSGMPMARAKATAMMGTAIMASSMRRRLIAAR